MGLIYMIYNDVNDKVYIGQTQNPMNIRWNGHLSRARNITKDSSAIHYAMNKYGLDKFHYKILQDGIYDQNELNEQECNYIKKYNSIAPNGYNIALGGEGRTKIDYNKLVEQYYECNQNQTEVARRYGYHPGTVHNVLTTMGVKIQSNAEKQGVQIYECDIDNNILKIFNNITEIVNEYPELEMTNKGINHYLSMQNTRANSYRGKYFCRVRDYEEYKTKNHHSKVKYQPVCCRETGMEFAKLADAARWIKEEYPEYKGSIDTIAVNISKAIRNNHNSYKHSWYFLNSV